MNAKAAHRPLRHARDYAQAIVEAHGNVDRQREIFASCPLEMRAMVRDMAKRALAEAEQRTAQLVAHRQMLRRAIEREPEPLKPTPRISDLPKSSPEVGRARLAELRASLHKESA
jgi:leucyl aminopeptidase (aminopeptidase T)